MRKIYVLILCSIFIVAAQATYKKVTVKQIQQVPLDSLLKADTLGIGNTTSWTLQTSPLDHITGTSTEKSDSVEITALVVVPPKIITFTGNGRTMIVCDTGATMNQPWSHVFIRYGGTDVSFDGNGYLSIKAGDIITVKGTIAEFPKPSMNSLTQFAPDVNEPVIILSSNNKLPIPPVKNISDLNVGPNPGGKVLFSGGEQWESQELVFTNLTISAQVNTTRGTWAVTDVNGNTISMYDYSYHFTLDTTAVDRVANPHDTNYKVPPVGTKIDTIRGFIGTSSGQEATRGYRLCPIYPEDVKYGATLPGISTHRRYPVVVLKDTLPVIQAKVYKQPGGSNIASIKLVYRVNNGVWAESTMTAAQASVDSLYSAKIPKQNPGNYVYYFIKVVDANAGQTILANTSNLNQFDSSKGVFFYKVIDRSTQPLLTIRDIQYTPFINGRSPYVGAIDSVGGIVTADTASLLKAALSAGGTYAYYIQSTNQPNSGLWVAAGSADSLFKNVLNGDSIIVTGTISENFEVTELYSIKSVRIISKGNPLPMPLKFRTEQFGANVSNGNFNAEPYEGMLVQFDSLTVTSIDPVFQDLYQYEVSNSSQSILVTRDGKNTYTNDTASTATGTKLKVGNKIKSLTGVLYYGGNRYKVVPRTNADYSGVTSVPIYRTDIVPEKYELAQNYPNPFNPTTKISYGLPISGHVMLKVYNVIGQEIATLVDAIQSTGTYTVQFDASKLSSGMYLYRISSGNYVQVKKMILIK
jgi:hypothetical protein